MKINLISFILLTIISTIAAQQKQVCFTLDDLPFVALNHKENNFQTDATIKTLAILNNYKIPAAGFVNECKLYNDEQIDSQKVNILKLWLKAGMDLGNHTFSHPDFHKISCSVFFEDIQKNENVTKSLLLKAGKSFNYFRHPFLHIGETKEKADSLNVFLKNKNYVEAPVTIDNSDWIFNKAYDTALLNSDTVLMKSIGDEYINYMEDKLHYYEKRSMELFGYFIKQILLLHANALNADYLDKLAAMYKRNNYEFISINEALKDPAYLTEVTVFKKWGISWLDRWALSRGMKRDFFKDDPVTPAFIMKLANVESE